VKPAGSPLDPSQAILDILEREIGRRGVLSGSASGLLLLTIGSLLPSGCRSYPTPPVPLKFLTAQEYATFQAIARATLGLEDEAVDVAAEVDRQVERMSPTLQRDIHWILRIFEHGTHLFDLKGKRFTRLSREDQEHYLKGWMESSLGARRIVFRGLKLLSALGYYGLPETWRAIGYDGPWLGRRPEQHRATFEQPAPLGAFTQG
jgi:hypothetical protein